LFFRIFIPFNNAFYKVVAVAKDVTSPFSEDFHNSSFWCLTSVSKEVMSSDTMPAVTYLLNAQH
jgi:hypothetical protein